MKNILILFMALLFVSCVSTKDYHFKLSKNGDIDLNGKSIKKVSQIELDSSRKVIIEADSEVPMKSVVDLMAELKAQGTSEIQIKSN